MKKVIALALTLAMVLAIGVTAFAATPAPSLMAGIVGDEIELGDTIVIIIENGVKDMVVSDVNGKLEVTDVMAVAGTTNYVAKVTAKELGLTKLVADWSEVDGEGYTVKGTADLKTLTVVEAEEDIDEGYFLDLEDVDVDYFTNIARVPLYLEKNIGTDAEPNWVECDGITARLYNAITKLHPEKIILAYDDFAVILYRGDYTTLKLDRDVMLHANVEVSDRLYDAKGKDMNNRVLTALGNNKADPYYVVVDTARLDVVAENPELTVSLEGTTFEQWAKTNDVKNMNLYIFDEEDDTIELVEKNVSVNNLFDNWVEMPQYDSATYVFVDADNAATGSANVKPNASTGANDMVAVAVVFATIALAAGVAKAR